MSPSLDTEQWKSFLRAVHQKKSTKLTFNQSLQFLPTQATNNTSPHLLPTHRLPPTTKPPDHSLTSLLLFQRIGKNKLPLEQRPTTTTLFSGRRLSLSITTINPPILRQPPIPQPSPRHPPRLHISRNQTPPISRIPLRRSLLRALHLEILPKISLLPTSTSKQEHPASPPNLRFLPRRNARNLARTHRIIRLKTTSSTNSRAHRQKWHF